MPWRLSSSASASWYAADRVADDVAWIRIWLTEFRVVPPNSRAAAVVSGTTAWSSGSATVDELDDDPTLLSTPITDIGTPATSTVWPTGSRKPKSSWAVVAPRTTTGALVDRSWATMNRPSVIDRPRTVSHDGSVPTTVVVQLVVPATRLSLSESAGATEWMSGATTLEVRAAASPTVSVEAEPKPPRMPELDVVLPGVTVSRLDPRAVISEPTCCWAPSPRPTVRMTAVMPIMMPSTVSVDRSRWDSTASRPVRNVSRRFIRRALR